MIRLKLSTFQIFSIGIFLGLFAAWSILAPIGIVGSDSILTGYKTVLTDFILRFSLIFIPAFIMLFILSFIASKWIDNKYPFKVTYTAIFIVSMTILNITTIVTTICVLLFNFTEFMTSIIDYGFEPIYAVNLVGFIPVLILSALIKTLRDNRIQ